MQNKSKKLKPFAEKLVKREVPLSPEEQKELLLFYGEQARRLSREANERAYVDWDKINKYVLV